MYSFGIAKQIQSRKHFGRRWVKKETERPDGMEAVRLTGELVGHLFTT